MALTRNGVAVDNPKRNGVTLAKVMVNGLYVVWEAWKKMTGELAKITSSFKTTNGAGASSIFKFDTPIRNFSGQMVVQGSGGNATYRQFGTEIYCFLDSSCKESNMKKIACQYVTNTNQKTVNFSLNNTEVYGIKYTVWSADSNGGSLGTNTCTSAKITSWEQKGA